MDDHLSLGAILGTILTMGYGWLKLHLAGIKQEAAEELKKQARRTLESIVAQVINTEGTTLANVASRFEDKATASIAKLGVPPEFARTTIHEFTEHALAELHEKLDLWTKSMNKSLETASAEAQATLDVLNNPKPIVPTENMAAKPGELGWIDDPPASAPTK